MSTSIGPIIKVDGEAEYRKQMQRIIQENKTLAAEMKAVSAGFDKSTSAQEKAEKTAEVLTKQVDNQKERVKLLSDMWEKARAKLGENSVETLKYEELVHKANAQLSQMESELSDTQEALDGTSDAMDETADAMDEASDSAAGFSEILSANFIAQAAIDFIKDFGREVVDFAKEAVEAAADVSASNAQFEQTFGELEGSATKSLKKISSETGIAATRMKASYTSIYAFAKTTGAESEDALDIASRAMAAAADSAAYYDRSIEEVTESLQSFLKGNYANDAALGISATETTRNTKANEMYAKSFKDLSESQKVDVLLAMVEAGNQASGAIGQAARESEAWANVTGELSEAWRQFQAAFGAPLLEAAVPVIQAITSEIYNLINITDADQLSKNMDNFTQSIDDAGKKFESSKKSAESSALAAEYYVDRLSALEDQGLDTAESQQEYAAIVELLSETMPDLNLEIDEQTGLLKTNAKALLKNIDAMKEAAVQQAMYAKFNDILQAGAEAQANVNLAKARQIELDQQETTAKAQLTAYLDSLTAGERTYLNTLMNAPGFYNRVAASSSALSAVLSDEERAELGVNNTLYELVKAYADASTANTALTREIKDAEKQVSAYSDELKTAEDYISSYMGATAEAAGGQGEMTGYVEESTNAIAALSKEYEKAAESALQSINSQIGYFDELKNESDWTAKSIVENWESQRQAFARYSENLQKAVDMGLDEALVQQLSDGTEQSMQILDELVNGTDLSVDDINESFQGMYEARETAAGAMAEVNKAVTDAIDGLPEDMRKYGADTGQGLADGMRSKAGEVSAASNSLARAARNTYAVAMDIHSPSRVTRQLGRDTGKGVVVGVEDMISDYERAMSRFATAGVDAFSWLPNNGYDTISIGPISTAPGKSATQNSYSFGDMSIAVYQQPGEDAGALAMRIMDEIQHEIDVREAGLAG